MATRSNVSTPRYTTTRRAKHRTGLESTAAIILNVVRRLASCPESATVRTLSTSNTNTILLTIDSSDIARVMGEDGRTARSLRSVTDAMARTCGERFHLAIEAIDRNYTQATP